jgi:hypothetical protein
VAPFTPWRPNKAPLGLALAALGVIGALVLAGTAGGTSGPTVPTLAFQATATPSFLHRSAPTPIGLTLEGRIATLDESHVPPVKEFVLDLDRHIDIDARGLPVCRGSQRDIRSNNLGSRCPDAIVGKGQIEVQVQFLELVPVYAKSKLIIVNGGNRGAGNTTLYAIALVTLPITTSFVMPITITRREQGDRMVFDVPEIAGGAGSLIYLGARMRRGFTKSGRTVDLLTATCPGGAIGSTMTARFPDGAAVRQTSRQTCVPRPG